VPLAAIAAAVADAAVVSKLISVFLTVAYVVRVPTVGDNMRIPAGASVISIVISPYKLVSMMDVLAFPPNIPNH
jgi:hypothetical protein